MREYKELDLGQDKLAQMWRNSKSDIERKFPSCFGDTKYFSGDAFMVRLHDEWIDRKNPRFWFFVPIIIEEATKKVGENANSQAGKV